MPVLPLRLAVPGTWTGRGPGLAANLRASGLDVVAGVAAAATFATSATGSVLPTAWWVALPTATWVVYSIDHLADARRATGPFREPRRRLFQRHRNALAVVTAVTAVVSIVAAFSLPTDLLATGLAVAFAAVAHLVLAQTVPRFPREASKGVVYGAGIWYGPLLVAAEIPGWVPALVAAHLFAVWGNLVVVALLHREERETDTPFAEPGGDVGPRRAGRALAAASVLASIVAIVVGHRRLVPHACVLVVLALVPPLLERFRDAIGGAERCRALADAAWMLMALPALILRIVG